MEGSEGSGFWTGEDSGLPDNGEHNGELDLVLDNLGVRGFDMGLSVRSKCSIRGEYRPEAGKDRSDGALGKVNVESKGEDSMSHKFPCSGNGRMLVRLSTGRHGFFLSGVSGASGSSMVKLLSNGQGVFS